MNLPHFYSISAAWLFLLFVPLIIFYFLKLKRPRLEIPSLALWRQVLNDNRVNSPFQKFKRNLLLLLQALLLLLLILAAMQPFFESGAERARYLPVLIDNSASMAALDKPGGQRRIDVAKQRVGELIDNLLPDQRLSLVTMGSTARRVTDFTDNQRVLHDALDQIVVDEVPSNAEDALRITQAMARTEPIETVVVYSDGNFPSKVNFELPFDIDYQQLDPGGSNMGITEFNARRRSSERWEVFVRVEAANSSEFSADIELLQDGEVVGREPVVLTAGQSERIVFRVDAPQASSLEARLLADGFDSLESDNTAFLELPAPRELLVYCNPELVVYRHALDVLGDEILLYPDAGDSGAGPGVYDCLISDSAADLDREADTALFIGVVPEGISDLVTIETGQVEIVDWERNEPLLQYVKLDNVQITDEAVLADGVAAADFEERGYEIIAHGQSGPLMLKKDGRDRLAYYMLFHSQRSTLPYRVGFPIMVSNLTGIATRRASLTEVRGPSTPVLPRRTLLTRREYRVVGPNGESITTQSDESGLLTGVAALRVGRYEVEEGGRTVDKIGVALLSNLETSLVTQSEIQFNELSVTASQETVDSDRPLWPWFTMAAFGFLLLEWWVFQRRPGGAR